MKEQINQIDIETKKKDEINEIHESISIKDDMNSLIPDLSMQNDLKTAIRDIENVIDKEDMFCENMQQEDLIKTETFDNDIGSEDNTMRYKDHKEEEKVYSKLTRKGSTKSSRRIDHRLENKDNNKTFHIRKLNDEETLKLAEEKQYPTISEESGLPQTPRDRLTSILSNITITYQVDKATKLDLFLVQN